MLLGEKIDINVADARAFEALERIGPALAGRIVLDRDTQGPFASIEDLMRVNGIGPHTIERNRMYLSVSR